jgi:hypothetical protein
MPPMIGAATHGTVRALSLCTLVRTLETLMNKTLALSLFAACASLALGGCSAPEDGALDDEELVGAVQQGIGDDPPTGPNHFCPTCFWAVDTQQAYRTMGAGALDQGGGVLPNLTISHVYRREVLQNAIECALGQDQQLTDPAMNVTFTGHWGLARSWVGAALTTAQRRWVTGCMAQRLNAFGMPVTILLKGRHMAINKDALLDLKFPWDESTVWGDLFSSEAPLGEALPGALQEPPFQLYACSDTDLENSCNVGDTPENWLEYRICDSSPFCGLTVLGSCSDVAVCTVGITGYPICTSPAGAVTETVHVQLTGGTCAPAP